MRDDLGTTADTITRPPPQAREQLLNVPVFEVWYPRAQYMVVSAKYDGDCIDLNVTQVIDRARRGFRTATERLAFYQSLIIQRDAS